MAASASPFHLGFFTAFAPDEWNGPLASGGGDFWTGDFYVDIARDLERAKFDFILFEDAIAVPDSFGGSRDVYLENAFVAPKHDPVPLTAVIGSHTRHLGVAATMSTTWNRPYSVARLASTIDSMTGGRFGWNLVTTAGAGIAENFGVESYPGHDERYAIAHETVTIAKGLWDSWSPTAVVRDHATGVYADPAQVHEINYRGEHFASRGPLNTVRSPQGRPVLIQAGSSEAGRDFAAAHAECIVATERGPEAMRAFRDDMRRRLELAGRHPDSCKVMYLVTPIVGRTDSEAEALYRDILATKRSQLDILARMSGWTGHDLSVYDLDQPLPRIHTEGSQGILERLAQWGSGKTLRECIVEMGFSSDSVDLIGSAETVAEEMCAVMDEVGGDGYLIEAPGFQPSRWFVTTITDALVPALQRRGRVRTEYTGTTLRENLLAF
ncbi:NtaA/DmoA family FMN-dependent monooxygenase [Herbiconiux moechotypicola]|uniref:NtaA/DmoA family FMN-dependent monooxygenase n=1 Tax=Herbiconiux moechotypicola TaxID=637393 RepID=A0ABN3E4A9_9MICO|nr:NtaA/DmoA family FMN-dependent monooxygenase [Herbiconiux moechotypicola]MCS5731585.1 NtaA/DmoA family FMN-dependent monooxygenase [Herbiconiux moechotypicola]